MILLIDENRLTTGESRGVAQANRGSSDSCACVFIVSTATGGIAVVRYIIAFPLKKS